MKNVKLVRDNTIVRSNMKGMQKINYPTLPQMFIVTSFDHIYLFLKLNLIDVGRNITASDIDIIDFKIHV